MTIILGTLNTGTLLHGTIEGGNPDFGHGVQKWFGVYGEYHLLGAAHGRNLEAWLLLSGYASEDALQTAVEDLNAKTRQNGNMTCAGHTYTDTIFLGFHPSEPPWEDASGINGWIVLGKLKFRQVGL